MPTETTVPRRHAVAAAALFVLSGSNNSNSVRRYYDQALKVRSRLCDDFGRAFSGAAPVALEGGDGAVGLVDGAPRSGSGVRVDVLLTPTAPLPPLTLAEALGSSTSQSAAEVMRSDEGACV